MLAGGRERSMALRTDGVVRYWGWCGDNACETPPGIGAWSSVAVGGYHTIAVAAVDTDGDGRPDSTDNCPTIANPTQADCNTNGVGDACEVAAGAPDFNHDTIPDTCQCIADLFIDYQVNGADLGVLLSQWGSATANTVSDMNHDRKVDGADLGYLLASWGPCTN
jgi:hypothetical protein